MAGDNILVCIFYPESRCGTFLWRASTSLPNYMVWYPNRQ